MAVIEPLPLDERLVAFPHAVYMGDSTVLWNIDTVIRQSGHVFNKTCAMNIDDDDNVYLLFRTLDEALIFKLSLNR